MTLWSSFLFGAPMSASHGNETPVRDMLQVWLFGIMLPASAIAWRVSDGSFVCTIAAALSIPLLAIYQGAVGILGYRFSFGDAPLPLSPSHGVVIVNDSSVPQPTDNNSSDSAAEKPIHLKKTQSFPLSLGCQCRLNHTTPLHCSGSITKRSGRTYCDDSVLLETDSPSSTLRPSSFEFDSDILSASNVSAKRPLRLLVIGDSFAIGVGQARQCTPVMPETIAKTLSARLGGRVVYWTCHGAPGASTGWIVRELERGVTHTQQHQYTGSSQDYFPDETTPLESKEHLHSNTTTRCDTVGAIVELQSVCSDTDDSSTDESDPTVIAPPHVSMAGAQQRQRDIWRERLAQHRKRFDPEALGPYDIVVVMTGGNDLKSAFFPFLLTGEDAEFRRQAKARGGSYAKELRRLLETLNRNMRSGLQNIRQSVEAATETVIERVEETMERIVSSSSSPMARKLSPRNSSFREKKMARKENESMSLQSMLSKVSELTGATETGRTSTENGDLLGLSAAQNEQIRQFPLVVLPGMPSRALPKFRAAPLRWLAIPMVDIMDMHKRRLAKSHPGEVLFVPPPSIDDISQYETGVSDIWRQRCQEDTVLTLRDVRMMDCRRVEADLREYYEAKEKRIWTGVGLCKKRPPTRWFPFERPSIPGSSIFSVDEIHPMDDGYDFWGRYIANSIADEWIAAHPSS